MTRKREPDTVDDLTATEEVLEYTEDDARWDALLATEASQRLLEKLAYEALAEIEAGKARPMWPSGFG